MTPLLSLWPDSEALKSVMKTDAEAASEAVVLAVHQAMEFRKRPYGAGADAGDIVDESGVLKALLADDPNGRVIIPIVGASGAGKSHVVRWLDIQLRARKDRRKREVIRIPKGRSLKWVLTEILSRFKGPQYENYRKKLEDARDRIDPQEAAGLLCERLAQAVEKLAKDATDKKRVTGTLSPEEEVSRAFGAEKLLPTLLRNQALRVAHFVEGPGVVRRLVAPLHEDRRDTEVREEESQFSESDFVFSPQLDRSALGKDVIRAMDKVESDEHRAKVAKLLNSALDGAKRDLLGLSSTVTDLFIDVRKQLLAEGLDLVLLVEDFAVLSGLQGQLLQVMIQEATRDGVQELCVMRVALAYTDGYMHTDTVLTRAGFEYVIPKDDGDENKTLLRIRKLVAAYLNAARIGQPALVAALDGADHPATTRDWIPKPDEPSDEESIDSLAAFGHEGDIPLFPFSKHAIDALAFEGCRKNFVLTYNPRLVIQHVLLRVLEQRAAFIKGLFPEARFLSPTSPVHLDSAVVEWIRKQAFPPLIQTRYVAFLTYWAYGYSTTRTLHAAVSPIARCFGLPPTVEMGSQAAQAVARKKAVEPATAVSVATPTTLTPLDPIPPAPVAPLERSEWRKKLDAWRRGTPMGQLETRELRQEVFAAAVNAAVDLDWAACRRNDAMKAWWEKTSLALAASPVLEESAVCVIASESDRADSVRGVRISLELAALADARQRKWTWNFDGDIGGVCAEDDLARACSIVERHATAVRDHLVKTPFGTDWTPVDWVVGALVVGSKVLQLPGLETNDPAAFAEAIFLQAEPVAKPLETANDWSKVRWALSTIRTGTAESPSWPSILLEEIGARQGAAAGIQAIDISRIKPALDRVTKDWELRFKEPALGVTQKSKAPVKSLLREEVVKPLRGISAALKAEITRQAEWLAKEKDLGGPGVNYASFVASFTKACDALTAIQGGGFQDLKTALCAINASSVEEALVTAKELQEAKAIATQLTVAGRDVTPVQEALNAWTAKASARASQLEASLNGHSLSAVNPFLAAVGGLKAAVTELSATLNQVSE